MKDDDYLLRFLRDQDMYVPRAQEMFFKMLKWRDTNKLETILTEDNEDFARFDNEFRGFIEGCDLGGRPILSAKAADGDVAKEIEAGKEVVLKRYSLRLLEEASGMLRRMKGEGQNVSQVTVFVDLEGFSLDAHACLRCIPIYLNVLDQFQSNYPGFIHRVVAINTPKYAMPLWNTYKISASPRLREVVKIFGNNAAEWKEYLKKEVAPAECSTHYGGTRAKGLALTDLHKSNKVFKCSAPHSEYN